MDTLGKLTSLESFLSENVLGQTEPLHEITALLQRSFCGFRYPGRPVASMLLLGPTGVGKTESVRLFARHLFEDENALVRFDMSEFMNQNALGLLVGNHVGERGLFGFHYNKSGGKGVILFDEIEKAHPLVLDIFLQILSAARFTLANGDTLDLSQYVVAATSNIGAQVLMQSKSTDRETIERRTIQAATTEMRPETFGRFDLTVVFNKLSYESLNQIGAYQSGVALGIIKALGHNVLVDQSVIEFIQREGYSEKFGARPMQQAAMRVLGDMVTREMLRRNATKIDGIIKHDQRTNTCYLVGR